MSNLEQSAQFTVKRVEFAAALLRICGTAPRRSPKRILQNCLIKAVSGGGAVEIGATDVERWQSERVNVEAASGSAEVLVNPFELRKIATASKAKTLTFSIDGQRLAVDGFAFASENVEEFPTFEHINVDRPTLARWFGSANVAAELINSTVYATDSESSRYALGGILIETFRVNGQPTESLAAVGCDGRRLAVASVGRLTASAELIRGAIMPAAAAKQAAKMLANKNAAFAMVQLSNNPPTAEAAETPPANSASLADLISVFTFDKNRNVISSVTSRTVDGRFPRWKEVIPSFNNVAEVPRGGAVEAAALLRIAERSKVNASEENKSADFFFRGCASTGKFGAIVRNGQKRFFGAGDCSTMRRGRTTLNALYVSEFAKQAAKAEAVVDVRFMSDQTAVALDYQTSVDNVTVRVQSVIMPLAYDRPRKPKQAEAAETPPANAASEAA